jgi:hypothetical protein
MWHATQMRCEKASAVEKLRLAMKSASAKSLVNGRSQVRAVTCHLNDDAEKRQASKRAVEENESSVTGRSRCRGKAARRAERTTSSSLSSSSSSPSSIVKFHVTANEQI